MQPRFTRIVVSLLCAAAVGSAAAHEYYANGFTLVHPWADATEPGVLVAPVYFHMESVRAPDRLLSASSAYAEAVELRAGDDASAPPSPAIDIAAQEALEFGPRQPHLLMRGLKQPLQWGRSYAMTMVFEKAGAIPVMVSIGAH